MVRGGGGSLDSVLISSRSWILLVVVGHPAKVANFLIAGSGDGVCGGLEILFDAVAAVFGSSFISSCSTSVFFIDPSPSSLLDVALSSFFPSPSSAPASASSLQRTQSSFPKASRT